MKMALLKALAVSILLGSMFIESFTEFLSRFYNETTKAATAMVVSEAESLFDTNGKRTPYPVFALTEAFWCEKYNLALCVQQVDTSIGTHLHPEHLFNREPQVSIMYTDSSATLIRWAITQHEQWSEIVESNTPMMIDIRPPVDEDRTPTGETIDSL